MSPRTAQQEQHWSRLMSEAQAGDGAAYETLLRSVLPFIRALARRQGADEVQSEDIAQDVLLTVHRVRHTYDPRRPFSPWLAAIVARRAIDALRRRSRVEAHELLDDEVYQTLSETFAAPAANKELDAEDFARQVDALLATLPAGQRQAFELLKVRELSLAEAAAESGQTVGALKVAVHRAVHALRSRLARTPDEHR